MTSPRVEQTSDEIRRTARQMFSTRGFSGTSIRDIAGEVGIKGASMYNHFPSKEGILWDLTLTALQMLQASWSEVDEELRDASPVARLTGFVRAHVRFHADYSSDARIVNAEMHRLSPANFKTATAMRAEYERVLRGLVEEVVKTTNAAVPDLGITVYAILEMGIAVAGWYKPGGRLALDELCDIYAELARRMVGAVAR
jgi:AcrR family transcriptional regulator